jgi:glycosyltransferase involved in cell wall biosynthesis
MTVDRGSGPTIAFVIPTLNAAGLLDQCLASIRRQDYPQERVTIVIADGGSTDDTVAVAQRHGALVVNNPLRTGEAGKAVGVRAARADLIAFVDSDNELLESDWITRMVAPFADPLVHSSEVMAWAYVAEDGIVNRWCALTGVNDPTSIFVGNYGRWSYLRGRWTDYPVKIEERLGWQRVTLDPERVPTMGANGYLVRAEIIRDALGEDDYLFDIDLAQDIVRSGHYISAKVPVTIRHLFARDLRDFARKTRRRARDFLRHDRAGDRSYKWPRAGIARFAVATVLIIPVIIQAARGFMRRPDLAWAFHPVACVVTLWVYVEAVVRYSRGERGYDRDAWRQ